MNRPINIIPFFSSGIVFFFSFIGILFAQTGVKQGNPVPTSYCLQDQEQRLYELINDYRRQNNLKAIPLSRSLCYVASLHARDLMLNHPDKGGCNVHSWSNRGPWTPFCYPKDETKKNSVWDKPKEITKYPGKAYELVYYENVQMIPDSVMSVWKSEEFFNYFLLNTGKWSGVEWKAIGVAIFDNYASVWFGTIDDPEGEAWVCGNQPPRKDPPAVKPAEKKPDIKPAPVPPASAQKGVNLKPDSLNLKTPRVTTMKADSGRSADSSALPAANRWYIIVKSNLSPEAAEKLVTDLKAKDYPGATILFKDGKARVSVFGPAEKTAASAQLKVVKQTWKDAWLLKE